MVFTLKKMVVVFKVTRAGWASVVVAKTPFMKKRAHRELFPTELMEESASAGIFGINR